LSFVNQNLTTNGDRLSIDLAFTAGAQNYSFDYQFPINTLDGTIFARYEQGHQRIIEAPFQDLGITSESESISFGFRQPIIRKPNREVALSLSADFRRSKTFIFEDIPFSFAQGVEDGVSKVRALRFTQEWTERRQKAVFALRSQVSVGLGAFGATVNGSGSDGRFISWLGQAQWVRAWTRRLTTVARLTTQITGDSLLPIEQFSVGGVDTVRGYRQNQRSGDSAVAGSLELRGLVFSDRELGRLELATFVDAGRAWNNNGTPQDSPKILFSAGLGVRWQLSPYISTQIDWAIPINTVKPQSGGLQEQGVFFSVRFQPW
jgi:hemolysin activation/secretion protein